MGELQLYGITNLALEEWPSVTMVRSICRRWRTNSRMTSKGSAVFMKVLLFTIRITAFHR